MSLLPNILDVAKQYRLNIYPSTSSSGERICDCPFCGGKKTLWLNAEKNVFICNRQNNCGRRGGVLDFLEGLTGQSRKEIINSLKTKDGIRTYKRIKSLHPAMDIPREELKKMGLQLKNPDWYNRTIMDWGKRLKKYPELTKNELDFIWFMYQKTEERKERNLKNLLEQLNAHAVYKKIILMAKRQGGF